MDYNNISGGAADKTQILKVGDEILSVNNTDCTRMSRIEAWNFMKKMPDGTASIIVRHKINTNAENNNNNTKSGCSKIMLETQGKMEEEATKTKEEIKQIG